MKALVLEEYHHLEFKDVPPPVLRANDVLVRVKACGICGSDVHGLDGSTGRRIPPLIMGHEASGVIAEVGSNVEKFKPGERVTFDSTVYCGTCFYCRRGEINLCDHRRVLGVSCNVYRQHGAFAEYVAVPQHIIYPLPANISYEHSAMIEPFGKIDILVNNAGCNVRKPSTDVTWDDWNLILDTNLRGTFFVAQAVAKKMIPRRYGRIINIGSVTSVFGYAGLAPYCASRGGVKQLTMSLADDWGKFGITVNCLAPGWFKTEQTRSLYEDQTWVDYLVDRIPLKRPGTPHDLDGIVVFLASDAGDYITGQTILVDGGITTGATRAMPAQKT